MSHSEVELSRRNFLLGSAAVGGGLLVGTSLAWSESSVAKRLARGPAAATEFNAWIHIRSDNQIEFILDKAEMGQGVMTGLTAIVAEELDVSLYDIRVRFAPADHQYGNPKLFGAQITGGSTSVASSWNQLRYAAANVRALIMAAGAQELGVPAGQCNLGPVSGQNGTYGIFAKSGKSVTFGDVASKAAALAHPGFISQAVRGQPKTPDQYRILGKNQTLQRYDSWDKVTGRAKYGIDVAASETGFPILNCAIVRCPVSGGKLVDYQPKSAKDLGVSQLIPLKGGLAVVAETFWEALNASKKITCQWNYGPGAALNSPALSASYRAKSQARGALASSESVLKSYAAKEAALGECPIQVDATFEVPYLPHATMEPMNCTAHFRGSTCEIWSPTQAASASRELARQITGLDYAAIHVHTTFLGGGFGRRIYQDYVAEAVQVSFQLFKRFSIDRPVKVTWTREDDFKHDYYRPMVVHRVRGGLKKDGTIGAWLHHTVGQSIFSYIADVFADSLTTDWIPAVGVEGAGRLFDKAFDLRPLPFLDGSKSGIVDPTTVEGLVTDATMPDLQHIPLVCRIPYITGNFHLECTHADSTTPVGFWRSVGHSHTAFAVECMIDDLAHQAGRDPMELRLSLLSTALKSSSYLANIGGADKRIRRAQQVLSRVKTMSNWGQAQGGFSQGVALHESFDTFCAMVVEARVASGQIQVQRVYAVVDCGFVLTPDIVKAQVEGAIIFGLTAALKQKITLKDGQVQQNNFYDCDLLRMHECPLIEVDFMDSSEPPSGIGEPGVPPVAPALRNALLAATGISFRKLPLDLNDP